MWRNIHGRVTWAPKAQACYGILGDGGEHISELSHLGTVKLVSSPAFVCHCLKKPLRWKAAGVCSRMLWAYNEMVNSHGVWYVFGGGGGKEEHPSYYTFPWNNILTVFSLQHIPNWSFFFVDRIIWYIFSSPWLPRAHWSADPLICC